ncbi:MAG: hypothetical protein WBZ19_05535, partial [Chthoniobacterales bacterium]
MRYTYGLVIWPVVKLEGRLMPGERQTVQSKSDYTELDSPGLGFQGARLVELLADRRLVKLSQMLLFFAIGLT